MIIYWMIKFIISICMSIVIYTSHILVNAAPGDLDQTFWSSNISRWPNGRVNTIAVQPDGKIIIGGVFTGYNGTPRSYIARIDSGWVLDTSFMSVILNAFVNKILIQPDGNILVWGDFTIPTNRIIRLTSGWLQDMSFDVWIWVDSSIADIALQSDGKIVIAWSFSTYNSTTRNKVARLNNNGSLDATFNPWSWPAWAWNILSDVEIIWSRICVAGTFTMFWLRSNKNNTVCLNSNGDIDSTRYSSLTIWASAFVPVLMSQPDGKLLVAWWSINWNGNTSRTELIRIFPEWWLLDLTFNANPIPFTRFINVRALAIDANNNIIIWWNFGPWGKINIWRVDSWGNLDTSFVWWNSSWPRPNWQVTSISVQQDGKILIGGDFTTYSGINRNYFARLEGDSPIRDNTPDPFVFTSLTGQSISNAVVSNTVLLTGINTGITLSVIWGQYQMSIDWGISYDICSPTTRTWYQGNIVRLCQTTSSLYFTIGTMSLTAGTYTTGRSVRTRGDLSLVWWFVNQTNLNISTTVVSNTTTIQTSWWPWTGSLSAGSYSKNWGMRTPFTISFSIASGDTLRLSWVTASTFSTPSFIIITFAGEWVSINDTRQVITTAADTTPDVFSFISLTGQQTGSIVSSNVVQVTWINTPTSLSISNGQYQTSFDGVSSRSMCSSSAVTIMPNTYVRLCQTTSSAYSTTQTTTLTVGWISADWSTTTHGWVYPFSFSSTTAFSGDLVSSENQTIAIVWGSRTITITNGEYSLDNWINRSSSPFIAISNIWIRLRGIALPISGAVRSVTLSLTDGVRNQQGSFQITTVPNYDRSIDTTNVFFTSLTGVSTGVSLVSNAILITGIEAPIPIYTINGSYQTSPNGINLRSTCGVNGQVSQGEYVRLCQNSSSVYNTSKIMTVVISQWIDMITRTRTTTTHPRVYPFVIWPTWVTAISWSIILSNPVLPVFVWWSWSIGIDWWSYSFDNGMTWYQNTGIINSGQSFIVQWIANSIVWWVNTAIVTITDGLRSQSASRTIQTIAPPPPAPITISDLMIVSITWSVTQVSSWDIVSQTITYLNKTWLAWIATGIVMDMSPGDGRQLQLINRPYQSHPFNTNQIRILLPNLWPWATWSVTVTGLVVWWVWPVVWSSRFSISHSAMNDPIWSDNIRIFSWFSVIMTWTTGEILQTWWDYAAISPLLVLRQLQSRYHYIVAQRKAPAIMTDVANSPYISHIASMVNNGIMVWSMSIKGNFFYPQKNLTRWELIIILWRILWLSSQYSFTRSQVNTRFLDIPSDSIYARFVQQLDQLWWIDDMWISRNSQWWLYLNPAQSVDQHVMRKMLAKISTVRWYNSNIIDRLPSGTNTVTRWEVAYILAELIQYDVDTIAWYNYRLLDLVIRRLSLLEDNILTQRVLVERIISAIRLTPPSRIESVWLMINPLLRDLQDSLAGVISNQYGIHWLYRWWSDAFESLIDSWSR